MRILSSQPASTHHSSDPAYADAIGKPSEDSTSCKYRYFGAREPIIRKIWLSRTVFTNRKRCWSETVNDMDNSSDAVTSDNSQAVEDDNIEEQPADPELVGALPALFHTDEPYLSIRRTCCAGVDSVTDCDYNNYIENPKNVLKKVQSAFCPLLPCFRLIIRIF